MHIEYVALQSYVPPIITITSNHLYGIIVIIIIVNIICHMRAPRDVKAGDVENVCGVPLPTPGARAGEGVQ